MLEVQHPRFGCSRLDQKTWGHRTVSPDETLAKLLPLCEQTGITRIADITGLDRIGVPVYQAVRPMGLSLSMSQGKGLTHEAAKTSAIMEAVEAWHGENISPPFISATVETLRGRRIVDPVHLKKLAVGQVTCDHSIVWIEGIDIADGTIVLVPRDVINLDFTRTADPHWLFRSTNGLAGGNTTAEAMSSAIAEVIERDCQSLFLSLNAPQRAELRVDLEPLCQVSDDIAGLAVQIKNAGLELELFDLTNDIGVTTIEARIYDCGQSRYAPGIAAGNGTHLDPLAAVSRAITEAIQSRVTYICANRDDLVPHHFERSNLSNYAEKVNRIMDMRTTARQLDLTDQSSATPEGDCAIMLWKLIHAGLGPVISIDLTNQRIGIPIQKIIVPKLGRIVHDMYSKRLGS